VGYLEIKGIHLTSVATSYALFFLRGVWMLQGSTLLQRSWVRIVPHVIDTVLLGSAVALAIISYQYPFTTPWVTAKVVALVLYIGLGMIALKHGRTRGVRLAAWLAAQAVFGYIVAVALTQDPIPF